MHASVCCLRVSVCMSVWQCLFKSKDLSNNLDEYYFNATTTINGRPILFLFVFTNNLHIYNFFYYLFFVFHFIVHMYIVFSTVYCIVLTHSGSFWLLVFLYMYLAEWFFLNFFFRMMQSVLLAFVYKRQKESQFGKKIL